ncbi:MAG: magnesium transporter CorA family protein [Chloroflexi bacterium]|nr:magnesium transporter CorA family protein [Chloroflexota bacterium]MBP8055702.1 magnesium transporter CorA family protein [Chloroflexota bacterium]
MTLSHNEPPIPLSMTQEEPRWLHFTRPTAAEVAYLEESLGIPSSYIRHSLDSGERARIDRNNGLILIVLRVPYFKGNNVYVPFITMPLGIVLTEKQVITICQVETEVIGEMRKISMSSRQHFLLQLLMSAVTVYLKYLEQINHLVDEVEERLKVSTRNKEVLELLKYQKSLVYFTTALKANEVMMDRLQKSHWLTLNEAETLLLEDVFIEQHQALEVATLSENLLSQMMDAFASIIANNLNLVMEFLAAMTIILALPSVIASFYGMNVALPFEDSPFAFSFIIAISLLVCVVVAMIFIRRRWL